MKLNLFSEGRLMFFSASFIFFALMTVGVIFSATDSEYNLNQTIARGYISKNAVFFQIRDKSKGRANTEIIVNDDGEVEENYEVDPASGAIIIDGTVAKPQDPHFVINNDIIDGGLTKIEKMLSSGGDNYLAAVHQGEFRGVFYRGSITKLPMARGRFFTEEECLSRQKLAVIGKDFLENISWENGKEYVEYNGNKYEVIGVTGISNDSSLDHLIIVNLGGMSQDEQKTGRLYLDGDRSLKGDFLKMQEMAPGLFDTKLDRLPTPKTLIDSASGGMYLKTYLKLIMAFLFVFIYLSVVVQVLKRQNLKISVMGIYGLSFARRFICVAGNVLICSVIGLVLGLIADIVLIKIQFFTLPFDLLYEYMTLFFVTGFIMILIMALITALGMRRVNIGEVIRQV